MARGSSDQRRIANARESSVRQPRPATELGGTTLRCTVSLQSAQSDHAASTAARDCSGRTTEAPLGPTRCIRCIGTTSAAHELPIGPRSTIVAIAMRQRQQRRADCSYPCVSAVAALRRYSVPRCSSAKRGSRPPPLLGSRTSQAGRRAAAPCLTGTILVRLAQRRSSEIDRNTFEPGNRSIAPEGRLPTAIPRSSATPASTARATSLPDGRDQLPRLRPRVSSRSTHCNLGDPSRR
jgi:hypothetical protein